MTYLFPSGDIALAFDRLAPSLKSEMIADRAHRDILLLKGILDYTAKAAITHGFNFLVQLKYQPIFFLSMDKLAFLSLAAHHDYSL